MATQEIPHILHNPKVHQCFDNCSSYFLQIHFSILQSPLKSSW